MPEKIKVAAENVRARTLNDICENVVPLYFSPPPCRMTIYRLLRAAKVPKFKTNLSAKRGGGRAFYSMPVVEKLFQQRVVLR